jgi:hypothetical protein
MDFTFILYSDPVNAASCTPVLAFTEGSLVYTVVVACNVSG